MSGIIKFTIANNSITHLGRNLYSTTPPALAELVANAYDAYATNVDISITDDHIIVADNGKGLDLQELQEKYAIIGKVKKEEKPICGLSHRAPMGKKGIGKLAAFSLGQKYTVYCKSQESENWCTFSLDYRELKGKDDNTFPALYEMIEQLPANLDAYNELDCGFIVKVGDLRRKSISTTFKNIRAQLSRRFYLKSGETDFTVNMNEKQIDLSVNEYYENLEYLLHFGYEDDEITEVFDTKKIRLEKYENNFEIVDYLQKHEIKGWIGSVEKPKHLKSDGNNYGSIVVYMNGKIADENILKNRGDARIANQYIVGEIQANFFDSLEDPITSSRQGLDDSVDEVQEYIEIIAALRSYVIDQWSGIREEIIIEKLPLSIKNNENYRTWLSALSPSQQRINNKMITMLTQTLDEGDPKNENALSAIVSSIANVVNNVEISELENALRENDNDQSKQMALMHKLMDSVSKVEAIKITDLIHARLRAIDELEKLMDNPGAAESLFRDHLADNPWLLNPYWNTDMNKKLNDRDIEIITEKYYKYVREDNTVRRNFIDILVSVAEEKYPIIVELKKNNPKDHAKVKYVDIYSQINHYRQAIKQSVDEFESIDDNNIPVWFILSEDSGIEGSGNKIELSLKEIELLEAQNIKLVKYNKLLNNARRMYCEYREVVEAQKIVPLL